MPASYILAPFAQNSVLRHQVQVVRYLLSFLTLQSSAASLWVAFKLPFKLRVSPSEPAVWFHSKLKVLALCFRAWRVLWRSSTGVNGSIFSPRAVVLGTEGRPSSRSRGEWEDWWQRPVNRPSCCLLCTWAWQALSRGGQRYRLEAMM